MRIQVLTIFPDLFTNFQQFGLMHRGIEEKQIEFSAVNLRDFAVNTYGQVDDTPYGGGSGMVLRPEPAVAAIEHAKRSDPNARVVLLSPRGKVFNQTVAKDLIATSNASNGGLIFLCSRYEGVDQRVIDNWVDLELSIGDFILMGAETAAMTIIESITRLLPGVLGNPESLERESFERNRLEHSHYTKPNEFRGHQVPEVLLSGNHAEIERWRESESLRETIIRRPELISHAGDRAPLGAEFSIALIHHPVLDKQNAIITSSVTNLDIHDIARSARTYGATKYYVVHPVKTLRRLANRISEHWAEGFGARYNPNRSEALETLSVVTDLDDVLMDIERRTGTLPKIITTSAREGDGAVTFAVLRAILHSTTEPHLMLLGTGWGLAPEILARADYHLEPVRGVGEYNHLSVRAAAAIILDRLLG